MLLEKAMQSLRKEEKTPTPAELFCQPLPAVNANPPRGATPELFSERISEHEEVIEECLEKITQFLATKELNSDETAYMQGYLSTIMTAATQKGRCEIQSSQRIQSKEKKIIEEQKIAHVVKRIRERLKIQTTAEKVKQQMATWKTAPVVYCIEGTLFRIIRTEKSTLNPQEHGPIEFVAVYEVLSNGLHLLGTVLTIEQILNNEFYRPNLMLDKL